MTDTSPVRRPSPPLRGIRRLIDARVPMRDGVALSTDVYLPAGDDPLPVVLVRTPYDNGDPYYLEQMRFWTDRGYGFAVQDCRGRVDSAGDFRPWFDEATDGFDTQDWLGRQPWCNGRLGTTGSSYDGATQWLAAPLASPYLRAMVPAVVPSDYWAQDHYTGGAFTLALNLAWAVAMSTRSRRELAPDDAAELWWQLPLIEGDALAGTDIPWYREWLDHPAYDDFWRRLSTREHWASIRVPVLNVCGWYDAYAGAAVEHYTGMVAHGDPAVRHDQRLLIGPWHHRIGERTVGQLDFGPEAALGLREVEARFFDHHLRGLDVGLRDEPPVRLFTMGVNRWRSWDMWPPPGTTSSPWYLGDGELLPEPPTTQGADAYVYDPANPVPTTGGNHSLVHPRLSVGPVDQRAIEARADVLGYSSRILERPLEVTGSVTAAVSLSSDAPDTDLTLRLIDVYPDGRAINLCEGVLRARYHASIERANLLQPGTIYEMRVDLGPTSNVFLAGHRIRLDVSSSNFPRLDRNLNTGGRIGYETTWRVARNVVHRGGALPSRVELPIVPT
jgi:putative CocE/NonD family hydrolase